MPRWSRCGWLNATWFGRWCLRWVMRWRSTQFLLDGEVTPRWEGRQRVGVVVLPGHTYPALGYPSYSPVCRVYWKGSTYLLMAHGRRAWKCSWRETGAWGRFDCRQGRVVTIARRGGKGVGPMAAPRRRDGRPKEECVSTKAYGPSLSYAGSVAVEAWAANTGAVLLYQEGSCACQVQLPTPEEAALNKTQPDMPT